MAEQPGVVGRMWSPRETWPEVRVTLLPLPWTWHLRPRFYANDHPAGHVSFWFLFLRLEWWAQDRARDWFREGRTRTDSQSFRAGGGRG